MTSLSSLSQDDKKNQIEEVVELNVGGVLFTTTLSTLTKDKNSIFPKMFSGKFGLLKDKNDRYIIDRDGSLFKHILNYLRDNTIRSISELDNSSIIQLLQESSYFGLAELEKQLSKLLKSKLEEKKAKEPVFRYIYCAEETAHGFVDSAKNLIQIGYTPVGTIKKLTTTDPTSVQIIQLFKKEINCEDNSEDE